MRAGARAFPDGAYPREIRVWMIGEKAQVKRLLCMGHPLQAQLWTRRPYRTATGRPLSIVLFLCLSSCPAFDFSVFHGAPAVRLLKRTHALEHWSGEKYSHRRPPSSRHVKVEWELQGAAPAARPAMRWYLPRSRTELRSRTYTHPASWWYT